MPKIARVLAVLTAIAALLLGGLTAATTALAAPTADPPPSIAQLCAATGDDTIDTLLAGVAETDLVGALAPLASLTVPQDQGRVLKADVDLDDVRTALGCTTGTPTPSTTPTSPSTTTPSPVGDERDCGDFATRRDAQDFYDSVTTPANPDPSKLDRDGDGAVCEVNEGPARTSTGGTSTGIDPTADDGSTPRTSGAQVVEVPEGSASTGGGV